MAEIMNEESRLTSNKKIIKTDKASSFGRLDNFYQMVSDEAPYWPNGQLQSKLDIARVK